jgi:hypothetical protein
MRKGDLLNLSGNNCISIVKVAAVALLILFQTNVFADGLVAYYSFDNASDLGHDDSGRGFNLNYQYGAPVSGAGAVNGAASFDGVDDGLYFWMKDRLQMFPSNDFSISVWVKANVVPTAVTYVQCTSADRVGCHIIGQLDGGVYKWAAGTNNGSSGAGRQYIIGPAIVANEWIHIAFTFTPSGPAQSMIYTGTGKLYINGSLYNSAAMTYKARPRYDDSDRLGVGVKGNMGVYFNGLIDELAIYTFPLSDSDVTALYAKTKTPAGIIPPVKLAAYYSFDNASDANHDDSGNGIHFKSSYGVAPVSITGGAVNGAVEFNGTDSEYHFDDPNELYPDGAFTISAWAKADSVAANWYLTGAQNIKRGGYVIYTSSTAGQQKWYVGTYSGSDAGVGTLYRITGPLITTGEWTHIAFTFNPYGTVDADGGFKGAGILYINGLVYASNTEMYYRMPAAAGNFGLGNKPRGADGSWFDGSMDEFAVFRGVLTSGQIAGLAEKQTTPSGVLSYQPTRKLLAYYSFDNASDANHDDSGSGVHLTNSYGDAPATITGAVDGAVDFDGINDEYDSVRIETLYPDGGPFTVSAWARADNASATAMLTSPRYIKIGGYVIYTALQRWYAGVYSGPDGGVGSLYTVKSSTGSVVAEQWTHIAFTFNPNGSFDSYGGYNGAGTLYVNGVVCESDANMYYRSPAAVERFGLASKPDGASWFDGGLDDFAVFRGVLTDVEIAALAAKETTPPEVLDYVPPVAERELAAYYSFDNASALNNDDSGNGNNLLSSYGNGAPAASSSGAVNGAAIFDVDISGIGNGYYLTTDENPDIYPEGAFTVSTWAKANTVDTSWVLTSPKVIKVGGYAIYTSATAPKWYAGVYSGPDNGSYKLYKVNGPDIALGQWTHIAFTFSPTGGADIYGGSRGAGILYINGSAFAAGTEMYYRSPANVEKFGLGFRPNSYAGSWYDGTIDEFAVFKGALNETEVNLLAVGAATPLNVLSALDEPIPGDLNNDGSVDMVDFSILAADWMAEAVK